MTGQVHLELYIAQTGACWNTYFAALLTLTSSGGQGMGAAKRLPGPAPQVPQAQVLD